MFKRPPPPPEAPAVCFVCGEPAESGEINNERLCCDCFGSFFEEPPRPDVGARMRFVEWADARRARLTPRTARVTR